MASIQIHQDVFNFERKRKGITSRQLACIAAAVALAVGMVVLVGYALGAPMAIAGTLGLIAATPAIAAGFLPIQGMPADEFVDRLMEHNSRGNALNWEGEHIELERAQTTREYRKRKRGRGAECNAA